MIESDDLFEFTVVSMTGRNMTTINSRLDTQKEKNLWKTKIGQENLARLLELKDNAYYAYKANNMPLMEANIEALFAWLSFLLYFNEAHPRAIKGETSIKAHSISGEGGKLSKEERKAIAKEYWDRQGEYGAVTEIAERRDITTQTVRNLAKKHPKN